MKLLNVAFRTLGCKLNQLETESVADAFLKAGARICHFDELADLYVINTCTVTSKAEQKARASIRHALHRAPGAVVLVTGCYAQLDKDNLAAIHSRAVVLPGEEKASLLALAEWLSDNWQGHGDLLDAVLEWKTGHRAERNAFAFNPAVFAFHSRPSLKIEDGCNNRCTYCRVCIARGPAVSLAAEEILARVRSLETAGKAEVVLTGVNLSQYRDGATDFPGLLAYLIRNTASIRFRISSYEPEKINEAFLSVFAEDRIQPHVHLAMQSGSDTVLRRMARPYTAERISEAVLALRRVRHDPFLAADIIAGFPGETDAEFEETFTLLAELDLAWIHAFPFSARPGTKAFDMKPKIPERIAGERVARLASLAERGKENYVERWKGREVSVILEHDTDSAEEDAEDSVADIKADHRGTSANYLKLSVAHLPPGTPAGTVLSATIQGPSSKAGIDAESDFVAF